MRARPDAKAPITDPDEAQRFDLSSRVLRAGLSIGGLQWLFVASFMAVRTSFPLAVDVLVALTGIALRSGSSDTSLAYIVRGSPNTPIR